MKKLLHNRNFYLILILIVVIAALLIAGKTIGIKPKNLPTTIETVPTATPEVTNAPDAPAVTDAPEATAAPETTAPEAPAEEKGEE